MCRAIKRLQVASRLESHPETGEGCRTMYRIGAPVWLLDFTRFVLAAKFNQARTKKQQVNRAPRKMRRDIIRSLTPFVASLHVRMAGRLPEH